MDKAGGMSKHLHNLRVSLDVFQYFVIFMFSVVYVSNGYIFYALTYLELWPDYTCSASVLKDDCTHELMCNNPGNPELIRVDWGSTRSLHNWVEKLDLVCEPSWKVGLIGSMYLFGWSAGCLFVPRMGDVYGRRWPYLISMGISLFVYLGLILSNNVNLTMALFFLLGLCTPGKSNIAYVYLLELVPTDWQTYVGTMLLFADGSTMIFLSIYFRYISKDWLWFQIFALSLSAVAFIGTFLAPESPKYLYSYSRFLEARASLAHIARFNQADRSQRYIFDEEAKEE